MLPTAAQDGVRLGEAKAKRLNSEPRFENKPTRVITITRVILQREVVIETFDTRVMATSNL